MKKIIALLLALIMTFSVGTLAFAEDATVEEPAADKTVIEQAEELLGEYSWILDLPAGTILPALKIAKIALKFVKVYFKLSELVGNIPDGVADQLEQIIKDTIEKAEQESAEAETTAPAAA